MSQGDRERTVGAGAGGGMGVGVSGGQRFSLRRWKVLETDGGGQPQSYVNVPNGTDLCPLKWSRW